MNVTVGTFNLNNLFSRYNFKGEVDAIRTADTSVESEVKYQFGETDTFKLRTYLGKLVKAKQSEDTQQIASRILNMDVDVMAVQEVEDIDTLREFNRVQLGGLYGFVTLIEGNDPRLIDVGILSKLPLGGTTSWQHAVHPSDPSHRIFGRDLLQVEILTPSRSRRLFTIFNTHLKSHYVDWREDEVAGEQSNDLRRTRQAEMMATIIKAQTRPNSKFVVLGDMNDPLPSNALRPLIEDGELGLINALASPIETRLPKRDTPMPASSAWTHRYKKSGQPARYELYDQIWLSPSLANKQTGAWIDRRKHHGGDGSDHDPAWIEVKL